jgi:hypothetical protein
LRTSEQSLLGMGRTGVSARGPHNVYRPNLPLFDTARALLFNCAKRRGKVGQRLLISLEAHFTSAATSGRVWVVESYSCTLPLLFSLTLPSFVYLLGHSAANAKVVVRDIIFGAINGEIEVKKAVHHLRSPGVTSVRSNLRWFRLPASPFCWDLAWFSLLVCFSSWPLYLKTWLAATVVQKVAFVFAKRQDRH